MLFLGTFDYAMDERGRVPLPPRYRDTFRDGVVLSQGAPDRCLRVYTSEAFGSQARQRMLVPAMRRRGAVLRRGLFPDSHDVELDKQNRVLIPAKLRDFAGLSGTVTVIGMGEYLEIWSPEHYAEEMARVDEELPAAMEPADARE